LICTSDCLSWILAFTVAKYDTTSTTDAFDFSIFWTCSIKATTNDCKCLNVNRIHSKNFQKTFQNNNWLVNGHEVWIWSWVQLKHPWQVAIRWLPRGYAMKNKFLALNIHKVTTVFSLFCATVQMEPQVIHAALKNSVFDPAAQAHDRIFAPLD